MKFSRILFSFLLFFAAFANAAEITLVNWNMEWFPSGVAFRRLAPDVEQIRIEAAAALVKPYAPDIFFGQEIRDAESTEKLIAAMGVEGLKLDVITDFTNDRDEPIFQQCVIVSRYPVLETRSEKWHTFGVVDPPRGFAYALLDVEGELVACFSLHLKSNFQRSPRDHQLNILKRELGMDQLLRFIAEMPPREDGRVVSKFIIAGDFNTSLDEAAYLSENTIRGLLDAGFSNCFEGVPLADRITLPGGDRYPDVTFDYIFWKGFAKQNDVRLAPHKPELSDHALTRVTVE